MMFRCFGIFSVSVILTACGGGGSSSSDPAANPEPSVITDQVVTPTPDVTPDPVVPPQPTEVFTPSSKSIESVAFVDALSKPLTSADVVFTPVSSVSSFSIAAVDVAPAEVESCIANAENAITDTTDEEGALSLEGLAPGIYQVKICKGAVVVSMQFTVLEDNAATSTMIAAPLVVDELGGVTKLPDDSLIVSVSGIIYSDVGVVANAQVAISGGAVTNGAIVTAITDENGFYSIVINISQSKLSALQNATIQIVAEGFNNLNIEGKDFTQYGAFAGVNVALTALEGSPQTLAYEENFEVESEGATCGEWTSETLGVSGNENIELSAVVDDQAIISEVVDPQTLWHTHVSGLDVINQAYIANLVSLAPNDTSSGQVPDPVEGLSACWYGNTFSDGSVEEGNFLNDAVDGQEELSGGTSVASNAGALISPRIDFSTEVAPLALTFKTWWEIEAVNPNENGFDLMSVEYNIEGSAEGEGEWITLARLNPLTDPVGNESESIPYSNLGFNQAPRWFNQEAISLSNLAGRVFKLRFTFSTVDGLYNGFRGWLLDDVQIKYQEGTFPLWDESSVPDPEEEF